MITDNVQTMLFEAACFDGTNIRLSSKRVGLRTDASGSLRKDLILTMQKQLLTEHAS